MWERRIDVSLFDLESVIKQLRQSIMPITVLALFQTATLARFVRSEMLENLPLDYVRTARAKGIKEQLVVMRHVLRNSLIPVVTLIALGIPTVFAGALITEQIFRIPGIGSLLISGIQNSDTPVVMGTTFIFSVLVVAFNIVADVLYGVLDPRIRYEGWRPRPRTRRGGPRWLRSSGGRRGRCGRTPGTSFGAIAWRWAE